MKKVYCCTSWLCFISLLTGFCNCDSQNNSIEAKKSKYTFNNGTEGSSISENYSVKENTSISQYSFSNNGSSYITGNSYIYSFNIGKMGHELDYKVNLIEKINGQYCHWSKGFYSKVALLDGSLSSLEESDYSYIASSSISVSMVSTMFYSLASAVTAFASLDSIVSASATLKEGSTFTEQNKYTYSRTKTYNYYSNEKIKLDANSASSCPDGYSISIGLIGTFYLLNITYTEYTNWWWGKYVTQGTNENTTTNVIVPNETDMTKGYVLQKIGDSETKYYLAK